MRYKVDSFRLCFAFFFLLFVEESLRFRSIYKVNDKHNSDIKTKKPQPQHEEEYPPLGNHNSSEVQSNIDVEIERIKQKWLGSLPSDQALRIMFIHVGKAGGSGLVATLARKPCDIRTRKDCWKQWKTSSSLTEVWAQGQCQEVCDNNDSFPLSNHMFIACHVGCGKGDSGLGDANTYLVPTRHPITRLASAFNYWRGDQFQQKDDPHPWAARTFKDCFRNIDHAAQTLLSEGLMTPSDLPSWDTDPKEISCAALIQNLYLGMTPDLRSFRHFVHGYPFYKSLIDRRPEVPIVVARHEHQLEDLHKLDKALGGQGNFSAVFARTSAVYEVKTGIETPQGKQVFCCLIWKDIEAYQDIILSAANLNDHEKREALVGAFDECSVPYEDVSFFPSKESPFFSWSSWNSDVCTKYYKKG